MQIYVFKFSRILIVLWIIPKQYANCYKVLNHKSLKPMNVGK